MKTALFLALLLAHSTARGQEETVAPWPTPWAHTEYLFAGANLTYPQRVSAFAEWLSGTGRRISGYAGEARGFMASVEPGLGGGKVGIGYASIKPYDAGISGYSVRATAYRAWGPKWGSVRPNTAYGGVEGVYYFSFLRGVLGVFKRVRGASSNGWVVSVGLGVTGYRR